MKVTDIEVRIGRTVNMGNYESLRLDLGARVSDFPEGKPVSESIDQIRVKLQEELDEQVKRAVEELRG